MMLAHRLLVCAGLAVTVSAAVAQRSDILPPQRRAATVELAQDLAAPPPPPAQPAKPGEIESPFSPSRFLARDPVEAPVSSSPGAARPTGPGTDRELLATIAPAITPSGTMVVAGQPILLFGQKKIKVGDTLPITFSGESYILTISAIEPTSFTLRLRGEELTRPIKAGN